MQSNVSVFFFRPDGSLAHCDPPESTFADLHILKVDTARDRESSADIVAMSSSVSTIEAAPNSYRRLTLCMLVGSLLCIAAYAGT